MRSDIEERVLELAQYVVEKKTTVREGAKYFGCSKSTVHKDLVDRLPRINKALAMQVKEVLDLNKAERHIRGGRATKLKYATNIVETIDQCCK